MKAMMAARVVSHPDSIQPPQAAPGKDPHEDELEVRKVDGIWKAFSGADD